MPSAVTSGDELVVGIATCGEDSTDCASNYPYTYYLSSISDSLGSSFALAVNDSSSGVSEIFTAGNILGGSDSVTVTFSASIGTMDTLDVFVYEVSGYDPIASQTATGNGTPCLGNACTDYISTSSVPFNNGDFLLGVVYEGNCGGSGLLCALIPPCSPTCTPGSPTVLPANGFTSYLSGNTQSAFALSSFSGATSPTDFSSSYTLSAGGYGNRGPWVEAAIVLAPPGGSSAILTALSSDYTSLSTALGGIATTLSTLSSTLSGITSTLTSVQSTLTSLSGTIASGLSALSSTLAAIQTTVNSINTAVTSAIPSTLSSIQSSLSVISSAISNIGVTGPTVGTSNDASVATSPSFSALTSFSTSATNWVLASSGSTSDKVVSGYVVSATGGSVTNGVLYLSLTSTPGSQSATYAIPIGTLPTGTGPVNGGLRFPFRVPAGDSVYAQLVSSSKKGTVTVQLQFENLPINQ
jgi:hypothetical protein